MTIKHVEFGKLLYEKLISQKLYTVEAVARRTGTPASTLYKYCEGVLVVPAEFISKVYTATGDIDFLWFVVGDTDKVLIDKQRGNGTKSVLHEALDVTAAVGYLIHSVQKALDIRSENGKGLSLSELKIISKNINMVIKELEDLRARAENSTEDVN